MASFSTILVISLLSSISTVLTIQTDCNGATCTALTTSEKQKILDIHNRLRDRVAAGNVPNHPAATNMNLLIWDDGLQNIAQAYAESCAADHNANRQTQYLTERNAFKTKWGTSSAEPSSVTRINNGENMANITKSGIPTPPAYTIDDIVSQIETGWFNEYEDWDYGTGGCATPPCGHYTQMVWADTRYVGCGYATGCVSSWDQSLNIVCNYFPVGNYGSQKPYEKVVTGKSIAGNCASDRTEHGSSYPLANPSFSALCGGGACSTWCDGSANDGSSGVCDGTGCADGANRDCNDGTTSKTDGRNICATWAPTSVTTSPTPSPTDNPTVTPPILSCLTLSNFHSVLDGDWSKVGDDYNDKPYYQKGSFYLEYNFNRYAIVPSHGSSSYYSKCDSAIAYVIDCDRTDWSVYGNPNGVIIACASPAQNNIELKDVNPLQPEDKTTNNVNTYPLNMTEMHVILVLLVVVLITMSGMIFGFCYYVKRGQRNQNDIVHETEMAYVQTNHTTEQNTPTADAVILTPETPSTPKINVIGTATMVTKLPKTTPVTPLIDMDQNYE